MGSLFNPVTDIQLVIASLPAHYARLSNVKSGWMQKSGMRTVLQSPLELTVNIGGRGYRLSEQVELDLNSASSWDATIPTDYTVPANRVGKDFYIYACQPASGIAPKFVLSANSTVPVGYTAENSRKIGGFHCLCANVGTISGHPLSGYVAGDILPASIWDLRHRPVSNPEGMVFCEAADIWVDIYLQSGTGVNTASVFGATITNTRNWMDFVDDAGAVKKRLLTDTEFQLIAAGSNEETNIQGSTNPGTTGGHVDTAGRRMISNIGCEDCCGVIWQWLADQSYRYDVVSPVASAASLTVTVYHVATPGGNPIYLKFDTAGVPYLCCNMANDLTDKVLTFGGAYTVIIKHDSNANTGLQIYFNKNATQPERLLCNNTILQKDCYIPTNNPLYQLKITHNVNASTLGVPLYYDDGTDERLEGNLPSEANQALDLAWVGLSWTWYDLPGAKGFFYRQGNFGDVKLLAGASWTNGSNSGSRARAANISRWFAYSDVGCRLAARRAEPA